VTVAASFAEYEGPGADEDDEDEVDEHEPTVPARSRPTPMTKTDSNLFSIAFFLELRGS
jgi:hypothetical protein